MDTNQELKQRILSVLRAPKYRPLAKVDLAKVLGRKSGVRMGLNQALRELERDGEIARIRKNRYVLPEAADLVTGKLQVHQAGFGFLVSEKEGEPDIYIAAENTGTAMNGDRVVARITRDLDYARAKKVSGRAEGRVIRILERAHDTIVGTLQQSRNFFYVVPDDPRLVHNIYVTAPQAAVRAATKLWCGWRRGSRATLIRKEQSLKCSGRARRRVSTCCRSSANTICRRNFRGWCWRKRPAIPEKVEPRMIDGREDLRDEFIVTIDPDDARDFDDAINVEEMRDGSWQLGVHIADVSAYVTPGSALDREAFKRGNSVYLPDRVIPMLPERLSNGVCSLNPNVDRLTHSVFIQFSKDGRVKSSRFAKTVIRSAKRLTYREAYALMQSPPNDQLGERLHTAWRLASLLRRNRFQAGSLDLDFPEVKVRVDENGKPIRLERIENDESHQLIEEFMLAANEAVALELKNRSIPTIYRVHENPDPEKLGEFREFVLSFGYHVGDLTHRKELQKLIASFRGKPEEQALKIALLKSLKRARYLPQPLGHYGLAKNNYTHFTSPIRRYADLVVHRTLADLEQSRRSRGDIGQLGKISDHISTTERTAAEAEIDAAKMKKLEFFQMQLDARNPQVFRATVIDVRNYGLLIELPDVLMTGLIHVSSLTDDFYSFQAPQRRLLGRQSRRRFSIGDELRVYVVARRLIQAPGGLRAGGRTQDNQSVAKRSLSLSAISVRSSWSQKVFGT